MSARSAAITLSAQYPICTSELAAPRSPSGRNQASTPCSWQKRPMAATLSSPARQRASASASPNLRLSSPSALHQLLTNPPLRPLGPPPQMSCSSRTMSSSGSASFRNQAVHIPV